MRKKVHIFGLLFLFCFVCACGTRQSEEVTSIEQLNEAGRRIGVMTNTAEDRVVEQELPLAEIVYFKDDASSFLAVSQGKIDALVFNKPAMEAAINGGLKGVRILDEPLGEPNISGIAFSPKSGIPDLEEKVNAFLKEIEEDGTKEDMIRRWIVEHNETMPEIEAPADPERHIVVGTTGLNAPFTFYSGTELNGYDIELAYRFAAWLNASIEWKLYDYEGIISAAQSGDVDCIIANLFITPERAEALQFSDPTFVAEVGVMVRDTTVAGTEAGSPEADAAQPGAAEYTTFEDLGGKTVSMLTGAPFEDLVRSLAPDVKEFTFFNNTPDMLLALKSHKTDAVLSNNAIATLAANRDGEITLFPEELKPGVFGLAFRKEDPELADWQAAYDAISEETKLALWEKWTGADETAKVLPAQDWPGANGTVTAAVCDTLEPMSYAGEGGELIGFDVEMILQMAKERDVHVDFVGMEFSAVLSAVQAGKAQIGAGSIIVTDERRESVDFVEYYPAAFVLMVRSVQVQGEEPEAGGFLQKLQSSFEKTFVREGRWKLFVQGIGITLLITVLSILLGTLLGFGIFMFARKGNPVADTITRLFVWLVQGMPVVVLLMILYYIIFGKADVSGTAVSVVGFTLVFAAGVYAMLKAGVGAVDLGQAEAAYALGYTDRRAFYRIVLPQALPHFMPTYKGEITSLIKATAVVGYVAVQDLTKMGDLVRSRTYEAFFPLVAVAIIYFVLAALLTQIVNRIELRIDPRRRSMEEIMKKVNAHD